MQTTENQQQILQEMKSFENKLLDLLYSQNPQGYYQVLNELNGDTNEENDRQTGEDSNNHC